jgi:hypothetical protein
VTAWIAAARADEPDWAAFGTPFYSNVPHGKAARPEREAEERMSSPPG